MNNSYSYSPWLEPIFHQAKYKKMVKLALPKLKAFKKKTGFQAIAFTGLSGSILASTLAWELQVGLIAVRSSQELNCLGKGCEGVTNCNKYIIVDDLIDTGRTIFHIIREVNKFSSTAKLVGIWLYSNYYMPHPIHKYAGVPVYDL